MIKKIYTLPVHAEGEPTYTEVRTAFIRAVQAHAFLVTKNLLSRLDIRKNAKTIATSIATEGYYLEVIKDENNSITQKLKLQNEEGTQVQAQVIDRPKNNDSLPEPKDILESDS